MTSDPQSSGRSNEVSQSQGSLATLGSFIFYWLLEGGWEEVFEHTHATTHMWRRWCALPTLFSTGSLVVYCRTVHVCAWGDQGPTLGDTLQEPPTLSVETVEELAKTLPRRCGSWPRGPEILLALLPQYWDSKRLASHPALLHGFWGSNSGSHVFVVSTAS